MPKSIRERIIESLKDGYLLEYAMSLKNITKSEALKIAKRIDWYPISMLNLKESEHRMLIKKHPGKTTLDIIIQSQEYAESILRDHLDSINWNYQPLYNRVSVDFLDEFSSYLNWTLINRRDLSEGFIRKYQDNLSWESISMSQNLSKDFLEEYSDQINWDIYFVQNNPTISLLEKYGDKVDWCELSKNPELTESVIRRFSEKVDWENISEYNRSFTKNLLESFKSKIFWSLVDYESVPEDFIRENLDLFDWYKLSSRKKLTENFVREFSDELDWEWMLFVQDFSTDILEEFAEKFNTKMWRTISVHQKLSEEFIRKHQDKIIWEVLAIREYYTVEFLEEFKRRLSWSKVSKNGSLTKEFVIKNFKNLDINLILLNENVKNKVKEAALDISEMLNLY